MIYIYIFIYIYHIVLYIIKYILYIERRPKQANDRTGAKSMWTKRFCIPLHGLLDCLLACTAHVNPQALGLRFSLSHPPSASHPLQRPRGDIRSAGQTGRNTTL